jgi:glycosyltransferase involved in cell wall biosynthesis
MTNTISVIYGTNIWAHYQLPVASELMKCLGPGRFRMALFEEIHDERIKMGWGESQDYSWVIGPPRNDHERSRMLRQCTEADVMVFGDCPVEVLKARVAANKLTLVASERLLKKPFHHVRMFNPRYAMGFMRYRTLVNHPNVHSLAIGHYAANDLRTIGAFSDRIWKWGYFVDVCHTPPVPVPDRPLKLLWVGRVLNWKKVDTLLRAVAKIQNSPRFGECTIVGDGPEKNHLLRLAQHLRLKTDRVHFLSSVPFDEVRRMMRESDVYVLPSNRHEGWGVVVGEAMSEGCVLVANEQAGASREQIVDSETGFLYRDCDVDQLASILEHIAKDYELRMKIRQKAWAMMNTLWHPRVAAERLLALCEGLLGINSIPNFEGGPCSKAVTAK